MPKQSRPFCFTSVTHHDYDKILWPVLKQLLLLHDHLTRKLRVVKLMLIVKWIELFTNQAKGLYGWILAQGCASTDWKQRRTRPSICHYSSSKQFYWVVYYIALRLNLFILWESGTKEPIRRLRFTSRLPSHKITSNYWMRSSMISCKTIFSNCFNLHFLQVFSHFEFLQTFNDTKRVRGLET